MAQYGYSKAETLRVLDQFIEAGTPSAFNLIKCAGYGGKPCYLTAMSPDMILPLFSVGEHLEQALHEEASIHKLAKHNQAGGCVPSPLRLAVWADKSCICSVSHLPIGTASARTPGVMSLSIDWAAYRAAILQADEKGCCLASAQGRLGMVISGYQRIFAAMKAGRPDFNFSVILHLATTPKELGEIYEQVHEDEAAEREYNQVNRLSLLQWMGGIAGGDSEKAVDAEAFAHYINQNSVTLGGRIKDCAGYAPGLRAVASRDGMVRLLEAWLADLVEIKAKVPGLPIDTYEDKLALLDAYLSAWQSMWPEAWHWAQGRGGYILAKRTGISILFRLFLPITLKAAKGGRELDVDSFSSVLRKAYFEPDGVTPVTLHFPGKDVPLDWKSGSFTEFSSGSGMNLLFKELHMLLY